MKMVADDIFLKILDENPRLTQQQRVVVWEKCVEIVEEINKAQEKVTCLNV